MKEELIEKIELKNGLTLKIFDCSKTVTNDRCLVAIEARIDVEILPEYLEDLSLPVSPEEIRSTLGEKVTYIYKKTRNFVDVKEKLQVMAGLKDHFLNTGIAYVESPKFPGRLILSKYHDKRSPASAWKRQ